MAKATVRQVFAVTLTLTKAEAEVLASVLGLVGGDPNQNRRHADSILTALTDVGIDDYKVKASGAIMMVDK